MTRPDARLILKVALFVALPVALLLNMCGGWG